MAEYIERENYCKNICRCVYQACDKNKCPIWTAPAADVAPVRHGHWIQSDGCFKCSDCDYGFEHEGYTQFFNFCPACGAKMDGDNKL